MRRLASIAAVIAMAPLIPLSVVAIRDEIAVQRWSDLMLQRQSLMLRGEPLPPVPAPEPGMPVRARLLRTMSLLQSAQSAPTPIQAAPWLAEADRETEALHRARRIWAEADLVAAYREALRAPPRSSAIVAWIARSYVAAPYLKDSAQFRIRIGTDHWIDLPKEARRRLVDEAVWYARLRPIELTEFVAQMRDTPAYTPFMLRFYAIRHQDADWGDPPAPTPVPPGTGSD